MIRISANTLTGKCRELRHDTGVGCCACRLCYLELEKRYNELKIQYDNVMEVHDTETN